MTDPYYQDDHCTIYHADCLDLIDRLDFDVVVTDPPYGSNHASGRDGPFKGTAIANDHSTDERDAMLAAVKNRPALVFGEWRNPIPEAKQALVWDKGLAAGMGDLSIPWKPNWEMVFVLGIGFAGSRGSGVLTGYNVVTWASKGRTHPNMKPVELMRDLIQKCPDGVVLDPFAGSGSTLRAAKDLGRHAIGIEIEERYCEIAATRLGQEVLAFAD